MKRKPSVVVGQADMWSTAQPPRPEPAPATSEPPRIERAPVPDGSTLWRRWNPQATQLVYVPVTPCASDCTPHEAIGMGCTHCGRGYWLNLTCVRKKEDALRAHAHVAAKPWASKEALASLWEILKASVSNSARRE